MRRAVVLVPVVLCLSVLAACGGDAADESSSDVARTGDCEWAPRQDGGPGLDTEVGPPPEDAEAGTSFVIRTNRGDVPIELDPEKVCAATSFTWLAGQGYWDDSACHRMSDADQVPFGILQCGDPSGTGAGNPSYRFAEELDGEETYAEGTIAMAKQREPATSGGQFFLNYADSDFPAEYTEFGTIAPEGLAVLKDVAADGTADGGPDGAPATELVLLEVERTD